MFSAIASAVASKALVSTSFSIRPISSSLVKPANSFKLGSQVTFSVILKPEVNESKQTHYINSAKQPIEILQSIFTPKEFQAFCFGNELKYRMRAEYKGQEESDMHKAIVYNYWRKLSKEGHTINPVKDVPPKDYKYDFFM